MIEIKAAKPEHFEIIQQLAHAIWPVTFGKILTKEQISYMLNMMYSLPALHDQYDMGHRFLLVTDSTTSIGFAGYELNYKKTKKTKIHKLYVLPSVHGKGVGRLIINYISSLSIQHHNKTLILNVNRFNPAVHFYEKMGFFKTATEDIDIGKGFLMEDYVLEKSHF